MNERQTLVLVDGSALAFRAFYALFASGLRASDGTPTWAVYGFFNSLLDLIEKRRPNLMAVCFDLAEPTFRHVEYEQYKANRSEMPDELSVQWPLIKEGVNVLGIPLYELASYEADDVIGTVAKEAEQRGLSVLILTGDQDAFQLLNDNVQVLMPSKEGLVTFGRQEVFNKLGIWPEQVADYKGLCGDSSDNIPGIKGIGPKTAAQLLSQFQTLEGIYAHLDNISSTSLKNKLLEGRTSAFASRDLATIRVDVPLTFDFAHCNLAWPSAEEVTKFFSKLEFKSILKRLPQLVAGSKSNATVSVSTTVPEKPELLPADIVSNHDQLTHFLQEISKRSVFTVDMLTTSQSPFDTDLVGLAFAYGDGLMLSDDGRLTASNALTTLKTAYIPLRTTGEDERCLPTDLVLSAIRPVFESTKSGKIAYQGKFKVNVCSQHNIQFKSLIFDPMLASYIVNPDDKHTLSNISERVLGHQLTDISHLFGSLRKQPTINLMPLSMAANLAGEAVQVTLKLACRYLTLLNHDQKELLWDMDLPLSMVLAKMEQAGVRLDLPYFKQCSQELTNELMKLEKDIYGLSGRSFNINSPKQLQEVLFESLKLPVRSKTKSGYSTDAAVLESLVSLHPVVSKILEHRQLAKLISTYVEALPKQVSCRDGRLHGEFNQATTATGRLSSTNPNLQNIPIRTELGKKIRKGFIPGSKDNLLISADYSQIELRILAHMSSDEKLIEAFREDQDIHMRTAMDVFDMPADKITPDLRRIGKTLNFALIYQQGAYSTAQALGVSAKEAQVFIDKYFASYPKVRGYLTSVIERARKDGYVSTLWGRRRYFTQLNDRNDGVRRAAERAACNAPLQGSAADLIKLAMIRLDKELTSRGLSGKLILQVHDELVLEAPKAEMEETKEAVLSAMSCDQPLKVPLKVDVGIADNWMDV